MNYIIHTTERSEVEGGDPYWSCSYDRGDEGMAEAFG